MEPTEPPIIADNVDSESHYTESQLELLRDARQVYETLRNAKKNGNPAALAVGFDLEEPTRSPDPKINRREIIEAVLSGNRNPVDNIEIATKETGDINFTAFTVTVFKDFSRDAQSSCEVKLGRGKIELTNTPPNESDFVANQGGQKLVTTLEATTDGLTEGYSIYTINKGPGIPSRHVDSTYVDIPISR